MVTENEQVAEDFQRLVKMGIFWEVKDQDGEHLGYRLTDFGIEISEKLNPDTPLHESYYKWQLA